MRQITGLLIIAMIMTGCGKAAVNNTSPETAADAPEETIDLTEPVSEEVSSNIAEVGGPYGKISVEVPSGWTHEAVPVDEDKLRFGLYGLIIKPEDSEKGQIELICSNNFGVCGTGLNQAETTLSGYDAVIGMYDGSVHWDYITFGKDRVQMVAQSIECEDWTEEQWDESLLILDTAKFDRDITEGGVGIYVPESEDFDIAVTMEASHVSPKGLTLTFYNYTDRDKGELLYGESFSLIKQGVSDWSEVPAISEPVFTDLAYIIPTEGKIDADIDWEWLYGTLTPGTYRIIKTVNALKDGESTSYELQAEFVLAE